MIEFDIPCFENYAEDHDVVKLGNHKKLRIVWTKIKAEELSESIAISCSYVSAMFLTLNSAKGLTSVTSVDQHPMTR